MRTDMETLRRQRILITGAAGFIGFHLAQALQKRGSFVLGIDNFNAYYDPSLKKDRARLLMEQGVEVFPLDIREEATIRELLPRYTITHVVHLAAQAGVRHSLQQPYDYVDSNLRGFVSMLEACRHFPSIKFLFASSSSVYGNRQSSPCHVEDPTDYPTNLYGATKKANEAIAYAYHHLYGLSIIALRYFTAYGPWGRPDMAYFHFAEQIWKNAPITLFNHGQMKRDFTYIDDIVAGTIAAIDLEASYEIFNLGNHCPIELLDLVSLLEQGLGKRAIVHALPAQPGEALTTCADITKSRRLLQFTPKIAIKEGIARFLDWFISRKSS
jgi:UDP-glucuronate 4-epimerase